MGMDYADYRGRTALTQQSIDKSQKDINYIFRLQAEGLALLSSEPAWSVYVEKLQETLEQHKAVIRAIESKLVDTDRPLSPEVYGKLLPQLAYARGYTQAVETALGLVIESNKKEN